MGRLQHNGNGEAELLENTDFASGSAGWVFDSPWAWEDGKMVFTAADVNDFISNGGFTGNANGWTLGAQWSYSGNKVVHSNGGVDFDAANTISQDVGAVEGKWYFLTVTVNGLAFPNMLVSLGEALGVSNWVGFNQLGEHTFVTPIFCTGGDGKLYFTCNSTAGATTIDNVSLTDIVLLQEIDEVDGYGHGTIRLGGDVGGVDIVFGTPQYSGSGYTGTASVAAGQSNSFEGLVHNFHYYDEDTSTEIFSNYIMIIPSSDFNGDVTSITMKHVFVAPAINVFEELEAEDYLVRVRIGGTTGSVDITLED